MERLKLDIQRFGASVSLTASETAVDETAIQNNQTYINLSIRVQTTKPTWNGNKTAYYQVTTTSQNEGTQTGSKYYFSIGSSTGSGDKTFTTTLGPFTHNADGTLNNVSISTYVKITDSTNRTATKSVAMATIPRASQPTISANPTLGSPITIYTNRVSSSFTHTITYAFGNASGTIGTGVGDSVNWTPAIELAQQIPNATAGVGAITCYTYNGETLVGTKGVNFTATVPGSIVPSISLSNPTIGGSAPAGWGIFVKGKSTASYTITGTGNQGSTISQYQSSVAGYSYTTANVTTGILYGAGTQTISAKVIDSRGRQATTSKTFNVVDYYNPSFTAVQIQRVDQNGNLDDNGEYAYFHFAGSVSSCSGNNKGTFKIAYRIKNTGSYTEKTIATNQESINQSGFITSDGTQSGTKIEFENTNTYDIKFMITDTFITVENLQQLDTGFDLLNFNPSGKSMAIGKVSEASATEEKLEIGIDTEIDGGLNIIGTSPMLSLNGVGTLKRGGSGATILSSNAYPIYLRPNGYGSNTNQATFEANGRLTAPAIVSNTNIGAESIELSAPTPFIDFHYGNNPGDYTSRIIEDASGLLGMRNALNVDGNLQARSNLQAWKAIRGLHFIDNQGDFATKTVTLTADQFNYGGGAGAVLIIVTGWTQSQSSQASLFLLSWSGWALSFSVLNTIIQGHGQCSITARDGSSITLTITGSAYNIISLI